MTTHPDYPDLLQTGHPEHDAWRVRNTNFLIACNGNGGSYGYDLLLLDGSPPAFSILQDQTPEACRARLAKLLTDRDYLATFHQSVWSRLVHDSRTPDAVRGWCLDLLDKEWWWPR